MLIVDDSTINLTMLQAIFKKLSVCILSASSGEEALKLSEDKELALAVIDVRMPGMDGYELAVQLNSQRGEDKIPVIFLTANYPSDNDVFKGYESGAVDYIIKPFITGILLSKVKVFLTLYQQKQRISQTASELRESLTRLQQLSKHLEKVREEERVMIARELHDELGQALTAVKIDLGMIRNKLDGNKSLGEKMDKAIAMVSHTIKATQRLTDQLRPEMIDDLGLEAAIEWYTDDFQKRTGIQVARELEPVTEISRDESLTLFRILQESLTNVTRHAQASQIDIMLRKNPNHLLFQISDNGIGIRQEQKTNRKTFGLTGMKERAGLIGATLQIINETKGGTTITVHLPRKFEPYEHLAM